VSLDPEASLPHLLPPAPSGDGVPADAPAAALGVLLGGAGGFGGPGRGGADSTTAQVTSWVESACAAVPAADYGGTSGSAGTLYACGSRG